ncbi:flippase-like domain-containing protein, partial [Microbacteriaceae bacterium K1510]|nr:flippase-like domain-containing protein [Microbacteriaceae bacterium K1510]
SPGVLASVFAFSMFAWVGETGVFWSVMTGFGIHAGPVAALLVTAFVTLSTLVPSSPGYVGPFHLAAVSVVVMFGISGEVATSFAVLAHL